MIAASRIAFLVLVVVVVAAVVTLRCGGGDDGEEAEVTPTATPAPAATRAPTPAGTPAPTPAATPARTAAPTPQPTPTQTATPTPTTTLTPTAPPPAGSAEGFPYSLSDLVDALAPGGVALTDLYDPASACAGAAVEGVPFVVGDAEPGRFAVWVLWVYPDNEAREGDWQTGQRAEPLVEGCEPPNGFVYWHENLLLWFIGFHGDDVEPGSPARSVEEVREHPVIRAFLGLTR